MRQSCLLACAALMLCSLLAGCSDMDIPQPPKKRISEEAVHNLKMAEVFLAANGRLDGVVTTDSGLQYRVLRPGNGRRPQGHEKVRVHYRGRLLNGVVFDDSYARDQPETFAQKHLILAWQEALPLMAVGANWELFVHPRLGYGLVGAKDGLIKSNELLFFELELLGIDG